MTAAAEVKGWVQERGAILHNGPHDPATAASRDRLIAKVGVLLCWELEGAANI